MTRWRDEIEVNLIGSFNVADAAVHAGARTLIFIASVAGMYGKPNHAGYCASKAGMDHYSRCVALEEADLPHGVRIVSLAPGVIDTDMQTDLRSGDKNLFPERDNFVNLKQTGALSSPAQAAARVLSYLDRADFGAQPVADSRDA